MEVLTQHRLAPMSVFVRRLTSHVAMSTALIGGSLFFGMAGFHHLEKLPWLDSFLNAAACLGGWGAVYQPKTDGGKLFAGCYALYSGLIFLVAAGTVMAPVVHRLLHRFHLQDQGRDPA